jgi:surface polysaccharide O-acyltransferase-like enzyme
MQVAMTRVPAIDAMRVFAMVAVIQIHTPWKSDAFTLDAATLADELARFAVPFFFIISGYLWAARCSAISDYWPRAVALSKRALLIFCFWSLLYAIEASGKIIRHDGVAGLAAFATSVVIPFHPLGIMNAVLQGTKYHLWFLPALAIAALISGAMLSRQRERTLFVLAIGLFIVGLAGSAYAPTPFGFKANFNFRNGPFFSAIMFVSGYAIERYGRGVALLPVGAMLALSGFALQLAEATWIHAHWGGRLTHDYVVGTYFFGLGVSMVALSNAAFLRMPALASIGPLILGVYVCHVFFVERIPAFDQRVHLPLPRELVYLVTVFCCALAVTFVLARWARTKQFVM